MSAPTIHVTPAATMYEVLQQVYRAGSPEALGELFPLPRGQKFPPPSGVTGHEGQITGAMRAGWLHHGGGWGLRLADGVLAIDVDHYDGKTGGETLATLQARLGALPPTFISTRRDPLVSGKHYYTYPGGVLAGQAGPDIDILQHTHRYDVAAPSVVDDKLYRWYCADGTAFQGVPMRSQLAPLPAAWLAHLSGGHTTAAPVKRAGAAPTRDVAGQLAEDPREPCAKMRHLLNRWRVNVEERSDGSRHDTMARALYAVSMAAVSDGHHGWSDAIEQLAELWDEVTEGGREREFNSLVDGALAKATTAGRAYEPLETLEHLSCGHEAFNRPTLAAIKAGAAHV